MTLTVAQHDAKAEVWADHHAGRGLSQVQANALYVTAGDVMKLDAAPARKVVDSFVQSLFGRAVDELSAKQASAVVRHIGAGDLDATADKLLGVGWRADAERFDEDMGKTPGKNGNGNALTLISKSPAEHSVVVGDPSGIRKVLGLDDPAQRAATLVRLKRNGSHLPADLLAEAIDWEMKLSDHNGDDDADVKSLRITPPADELPGPGSLATVRRADEFRMISVDDLVPAAYNPRREFAKQDLESLAATLTSEGQLEPNLVRPLPGMEKDGKFQIIAGERRWRASKLAKIAAQPCIIKYVDDAEAARICWEENHNRADLNPVEEARGIEMMIRQGGHTQEEMAQRLGVKQGTIANKLGVLKLPEAWQQRIISGGITATQARDHLLPWFLKAPKILDAIETQVKVRIKDESKAGGTAISTREIVELIAAAVRERGHPMSGHFYFWVGQNHWSGVVSFEPTDEQRAQLEIVEHDGGEYALNKPLWQQLQKAAENAKAKREADKREKADARKDAGALTSSEKKKREEQKEEQFQNRIARWLCAWRQKMIIERLPNAPQATIDKLHLFFSSHAHRGYECGEAVDDAITANRGKLVERGYATDEWLSIDSVPDEQIRAAIIASLQRWLAYDQERSNCEFRREDIAGIAARMGITLREHWTLSEDFLLLLTKPQFIELAEEWKLGHVVTQAKMGAKNKQVIESLLSQGPHCRKAPSFLVAVASEAKSAPGGKPAKKKKGGK